MQWISAKKAAVRIAERSRAGIRQRGLKGHGWQRSIRVRVDLLPKAGLGPCLWMGTCIWNVVVCGMYCPWSTLAAAPPVPGSTCAKDRLEPTILHRRTVKMVRHRNDVAFFMALSIIVSYFTSSSFIQVVSGREPLQRYPVTRQMF